MRVDYSLYFANSIDSITIDTSKLMYPHHLLLLAFLKKNVIFDILLLIL
jgi:hypothetical protein